jgi:CubicO group peptidase (beta-lactamase class C family)
LIERIGDHQGTIGFVVGIIEPEGRRIIAHGKAGAEASRGLDGDTIFEIGSVTKVFTSLLLADMVQRGEVALNDSLQSYLPPEVTSPDRRGRAIALVDLATHTSGLPGLPSNLRPDANPENPYANYSVAQLYEFLSNHELTRDPGSQYEYSNLGVGLLGHVLALRAGEEYDRLVVGRISEPLGLDSTRITLSQDMRSRLAQGHDSRMAPVPNWNVPTLAGAGALRSTVNDLLSFLAAHMGYVMSPLTPAMTSMLSVRRPTGVAGEIALGWHIRPHDGGETIWHNGGTGGYRSFIGYDPEARVGVVALTNLSTPGGVDDLGHYVLDSNAALLPPNSPLLQPRKERTRISVDPDLLDAYAGRYEFAPSVFMTITREGNQLIAQLTGQGPAEIFPESEQDFFYEVVDAQITFRTDDQGRVNALILHQLGRDQIAQKLDGDADPLEEWFGHKEITIDPARFDEYVGRYQLGPGATVTVTREGDHLFVQLTGQPSVQVFAETDQDFFLKVVDAQIAFVTDGQGPAPALVLHQNGQDLRAPRIE